METTTFSMEVNKGIPLLIVVPYGNSIIEMINILIESLRRAGIHDIYTHKRLVLDDADITYYQNGRGIVFTTELHYFSYTPDVIPIYLVEWGIRDLQLQEFEEWINHTDYTILYPTFLPRRNITNIIPHEIKLSQDNYLFSLQYPDILTYPQDNFTPGVYNILQNIQRYSPKIGALIANINVPCVIYTQGTDTDYYFLQECLKSFNVSIMIIQRNAQIQSIAHFINNNNWIILTHNRSLFDRIPPSIPIHILSVNSSQSLDLISGPYYHDNIHFYLNKGPNETPTRDSTQYSLLINSISDVSAVYEDLIRRSRSITIDRYNNLFISQP